MGTETWCTVSMVGIVIYGGVLYGAYKTGLENRTIKKVVCGDVDEDGNNDVIIQLSNGRFSIWYDQGNRDYISQKELDREGKVREELKQRETARALERRIETELKQDRGR